MVQKKSPEGVVHHRRYFPKLKTLERIDTISQAEVEVVEEVSIAETDVKESKEVKQLVLF